MQLENQGFLTDKLLFFLYYGNSYKKIFFQKEFIMFNSRMFRTVIILIVALVFASTAYAMAASNTLADAGKAGDGNNTVSGYAVTGVTYNLNATNPALIASVEFDLDAAASDVQASLTDVSVPTETFADSCTNVVNHWTCTFTGVAALDADNFRVIAAQ